MIYIKNKKTYVTFKMNILRNLILLLLGLIYFDTLFCQTVVVSPTKMNVVYRWLENPIKIVVENTPCSKVVVKVNSGVLNGQGCEYTYLPNDTNFNIAIISVGIVDSGKTKWIYNTEFRIKNGPNPTPMLAGRLYGYVNVNVILVVPYICAPLTNGFEVVDAPDQQKVDSFSLRIFRGDSLIFSKQKIKGNKIPSDVLDYLKTKSKPFDRLLITNIYVLIHNKEIRKIDDLELKIE